MMVDYSIQQYSPLPALNSHIQYIQAISAISQTDLSSELQNCYRSATSVLNLTVNSTQFSPNQGLTP